MTRRLEVLDTADTLGLIRSLRDALTGGGPALLPRPSGTTSDGTGVRPPPATVARNVALVIETSGSTGVPKRVALSTDALLASAAASAGALGGQGQWLLALPAHYVAGAQVLVRSIVADTQPVLLPPGHFDPAAFAQAAATMTGDLRYVSLVPVQLDRLLTAAAADRRLAATLRRFDGVLVGGQALRPDLRERALDAGVVVRRTYGSSETCGGCVYDGVPIGTVRARVVDGQIELAGPVLAEGYLTDAGGTESTRTNAAFHIADGLRWYRTRDLGTVSDDGTVSVQGRADNVIISGGEKVLLDAVERAVREVPGLTDAVVVAAPSRQWGQVPVVVTSRAASAGLAEVRAHVAAALGRAAAPAGLVAVQELPLLASGKPDRVALARLAGNEDA